MNVLYFGDTFFITEIVWG